MISSYTRSVLYPPILFCTVKSLCFKITNDSLIGILSSRYLPLLGPTVSLLTALGFPMAYASGFQVVAECWSMVPLAR